MLAPMPGCVSILIETSEATSALSEGYLELTHRNHPLGIMGCSAFMKACQVTCFYILF